MTTTDKRVADLLTLADSEGLTLPYPPEVIARLEDSGAVVDLVTGAVIVNGAETRYSLTVLGEATAIVLQSEV